MYYVVETDKLIADGVITDGQALEIKSRARDAMIALCVNALLITGIIAATFGLVFLLADALSVAVCGGLFLAGGLSILRFGAPLYRMFGNASALIGSGMLIVGTGVELIGNYPAVAGPLLIVAGAVIGTLCLWRFRLGLPHLQFAFGATLVMATALHIVGVYFWTDGFEITGWAMPLVHLYVCALIAGLGYVTDVRLITALAIVPFAQMLDTSTYYFSAAYVFYSPESTLSILQMSALIGACLWLVNRGDKVLTRQAGILMIMAFIVANLCFLVGSIWGDVIGESIWGPKLANYDGDWQAFREAELAYEIAGISISEQVYAITWALVLGGLIVWSAMHNRRGIFNTAMTFAAIHAYTQMFESFYDEPLAYVIGGLAAIPLAFGLWRLNHAWFHGATPAAMR